MDVQARIGELRSKYGERVNVKTLADGNTVVRISRVTLSYGCTPQQTDLLLILSPTQDLPLARHIKDQVKLSNGSVPSYNATVVDGETWYGFSYNFRWIPSTDSMYQYVESALTRFAKTA